MAEKKSTYIDQLRETVGADFDWQKMTMADLAILAKFFSNPKLVVLTFADVLDEAERAEVIRFLQPAPAAATTAIPRGAGGHDPLEGRPVIQGIRNAVFGGPIMSRLQGEGED